MSKAATATPVPHRRFSNILMVGRRARTPTFFNCRTEPHQPSVLPGGLKVVSIKSIKLPLSRPSPRAFDPAPLDPSRANIAFAVMPGLPVFLYFLTLAGCFVGSGENDTTQFSFIFYFFNYASGRASPATIEKCKILSNNSSPRKGPDETDVA